MECACSLKTTHQLKINHIEKFGEDAYSFACENPNNLTWDAGDYIKWFVSIEGSTVGQKYSFATMPDEPEVKFALRISETPSDYKREIAKLKAGDTIEISEPIDDFKLIREERPLLILSNGVGIATVRSLLAAYFADRTGIPDVVQINVDAKSRIYEDELSEKAKETNSFSSYYVDHREAFYNQLDREIRWLDTRYEKPPIIYVVGSYLFGEAVTNYLVRSGVDAENIYRDGQSKGKGNCSCATVNRPITISFDFVS